MMREIVVNGRFLSRRITGVERYGREILACIGDRCRLEMTRSQGLRGHAWEQWVLPRKLKPESVLWSPANTGPLSVQRQALTIHDLSALEHPEWFQRRFAFWYSLLVPMLVKRAGLLFVPSEYVKQKMIQRFQMHNVIVTPNGVNPSIFHPNARQHKYSLPARYVLFVGTLEPRKNLKALLQAWREMYKDFKDIWLVIAGSQGRVHRTAQPAGIHERVIFLGYVEESALPGLYAGASLFVLPSLAEGFGLPALEAMACGVPVLVSNGGALPEVVGDAGLIFDLAEPEALVASLRSCLQKNDLRDARRQKGLARARAFSWQTTADLIWNTLYES